MLKAKAKSEQIEKGFEQDIESSSEEEEEQVEDVAEPTVVKASNFEKVDISSLPADLRMDDYSDDEENKDSLIGNMIVGRESEFIGTSLGEDGIPQEVLDSEAQEDALECTGEEDDNMGGSDNDSDGEEDSGHGDSDSDSDLSMDEYDPLREDDREFEPIDIAG